MLLKPIAFRIYNYKSILDSGVCTLSGDGITVLAGQNEAGKTSVLQALSDFNLSYGTPSKRKDIAPDDRPDAKPTVDMLFTFAHRSLIELMLDEHGFDLPSEIQGQLGSDSIWISKDLATGEFNFVGELAASTYALLPDAQEDGESSDDDGSTALPSLPTSRAFLDALWNNWPTFSYFDSFDDLLPNKVSIDLIQKILVTGAAKPTEPELPSAVSNFLTIAKIDLKEVRRLASIGDDYKQLKNYLSRRSTSVSSEFLAFWKQRIGSQKLQLETSYDRLADGSYLTFWVNDGTTRMYPSQRSKGFLWFLSFYLKLAASVQDKEKELRSLILVDEPGSFLHPKAQRDILDVLEQRIAEQDFVLYSTHSPYLLPPDRLHRTRIVLKEENGQTVIADRLTDARIETATHGDALSPVLAAIGMEVSAQLGGDVQEHFIVEGISDYYYLHAWAKLLGRTALRSAGIYIANGCPNIPAAVSLALLRPGHFAVLLDRDAAAAKAIQKLQKLMDISTAVIVQPNAALTIEDIFASSDFSTLVKLYAPSAVIDPNEKPSSLVKKLRLDKVLLARTFAEAVNKGTIKAESLSQATQKSAGKLFDSLESAIRHDAIVRVV